MLSLCNEDDDRVLYVGDMVRWRNGPHCAFDNGLWYKVSAIVGSYFLIADCREPKFEWTFNNDFDSKPGNSKSNIDFLSINRMIAGGG